MPGKECWVAVLKYPGRRMASKIDSLSELSWLDCSNRRLDVRWHSIIGYRYAKG